MSKDLELVLSHADEQIALGMLQTKGNLVATSRLDTVQQNAMALRARVRENPSIRMRYHQLLAEELQEQGLHIAERILELSKLQQVAYGDIENNIPPDPKMAIELSKEISRLIAEGKNTSMSNTSAFVLTSKEDAKELLMQFLNGD